MSIYWDHGSQPGLLIALNYLLRTNDIKLYKLLSNTWTKDTIKLLQRARNIQTIIDTLVYNHSRSSKLYPKAQQLHHTIPESCGSKLVQTILHAHLDSPPSYHLQITPDLTRRNSRYPTNMTGELYTQLQIYAEAPSLIVPYSIPSVRL